MEEIPLGLSYDDVLIVPGQSGVASRANVKTASKVTPNNPIEIPLVSANMDTVTEERMALAMAEAGGTGVIHRNQNVDTQAKQVCIVKDIDPFAVVGAALGLADWVERSDALLESGVSYLVLDVAHGHSSQVINVIEGLRRRHTNVDIMAGNVVTAAGVKRLVEAGATAIKVGIGPGAACTTREMTGVGYPQFSAVRECVAAVGYRDIPIIADGGITRPGDVAKALAAGASAVMIGSLFAGTDESPGALMGDNQRGNYKSYRGMASSEASGRTHAEGKSGYVEYTGSVKNMIEYLMGGVRSAMSYVGATALYQFPSRASFVRVTNAGLIESGTRLM